MDIVILYRGWMEVWLVVVRVALQRVPRPGRRSLRLRLDGTRTHDRSVGGRGLGSVGLWGRGNVSGGAKRGHGSGGARLIVLWTGLGFLVRALVRVVEVLVRYLLAASVGL